MKMNLTPAAVPVGQYATYVHDCLRPKQCEPSYAAPLPGIPYLQLYVEFGAFKPVLMQFYLQDMCDTSHTEQLFPSNYVVGKTPEGVWYGVFKYFTSPMVPVTNFVVWLGVEVDTGSGLADKTYFTELLVDEPCAPLMKIKSCQPELATTTGFDINGLYYGLPVNLDYLGEPAIRYFHIAYVRLGKVRTLPPKATFFSSLVSNFRTTIEKTWSLETELVPKWYADVLLAIYSRGAVQINDGMIYLVGDLSFEALNDDDLTWKPFAQLKQTTRLYFGCDTSVCIECCSPIVLDAFTTGELPPESPSASASASASESVPPPPVPGEGTLHMDECNPDNRFADVRWNGVQVISSEDYPVPSGDTATLTVPAPGTHTLEVDVAGFALGAGRVVATDSDGNVQCQNFSSPPDTLTFPGFVINEGEPWSIIADCSSC